MQAFGEEYNDWGELISSSREPLGGHDWQGWIYIYTFFANLEKCLAYSVVPRIGSGRIEIEAEHSGKSQRIIRQRFPAQSLIIIDMILLVII